MASLTTILAAHGDPTRVSATQLPAVAGLNPFRSALELFLQKKGVTQEEEAGPAAYWGSVLEPVVLREYAVRRGCPVLGQGFDGTPVLFDPGGVLHPQGSQMFGKWTNPEVLSLITHTVRHPFAPLMAHLDGLAFREPGRPESIVQSKTGGFWSRLDWGEEATDQVPPSYLLQVIVEMACVEGATGMDLPSEVPVLLGGQDFRIYHVHQNPRVRELAFVLARDFVRRIQENDPPPAEPTEDGSRAMAALYPGDPARAPLVAEPGTPLHTTVRRLAEAKTVLDMAETAYRAAVVDTQHIMAQATKVVAPGVKVSWSPSTPGSVTAWKDLALDLVSRFGPEKAKEIQAQFTTPRPNPRRFLVTLPKKGTS